MKVSKHIINILLVMLVGCSQAEPPVQTPPLVKTVVVGGEQNALERTFPGRVMAGQRADLSFQVSGTLATLPVKEGQQVTQGQVLASLNPRDFQNRYEGAKSSRETAELNFERGKKLVASGTIARASFDELRTKYDLAKSEEGIAQKALEDTQMMAPFTGMIARVYVDNYQDVQAKEKIMTLQDIQDIDILIDVPERDILRHNTMKKGENPASRKLENGYVVFDGIPGKHFEANVKEFSTEADAATQTYRVRLSMKAPEGVNILPGMGANLIMKQTIKTDEALLVPASSVAIDPQGKFYVWVVSTDLKVSKEPVEVGEMMGDSIRITKGVTPGQRIVTAGLTHLQEGMSVRLFQDKY